MILRIFGISVIENLRFVVSWLSASGLTQGCRLGSHCWCRSSMRKSISCYPCCLYNACSSVALFTFHTMLAMASESTLGGACDRLIVELSLLVLLSHFCCKFQVESHKNKKWFFFFFFWGGGLYCLLTAPWFTLVRIRILFLVVFGKRWEDYVPVLIVQCNYNVNNMEL